MMRDPAVEVHWLTVDDIALARATFRLMRDVFGDDDDDDHGRDDIERGLLADDYLVALLADPTFWALAAIDEVANPLGGITAHVLPMTRSESRELFIYDLAVRPERQRQGIARALVAAVVDRADEQGLVAVFVPADNDDTHALAFYEAVGGRAAPVTMFDLGRE